MKWVRYGVIVVAISTIAWLALYASFGIHERSADSDSLDSFADESMANASDLIEFAIPAEIEIEKAYNPMPPESGMFRVSDELRPKVEFWKTVYTGLYSFQAVVHDDINVELVYGVVDLRDEARNYSRSFSSLRSAAGMVAQRYAKNLKFLLNSKYDPKKLRGEQKRLYQIIVANGGVKKMKGADSRVRIQRGLRDVFRDSIIRSGRYLEHFREIFRKLNLPEELTLLPHQESSFRYDASSYAGAVGIWQLTRAASRSMIHISSTVDERRDPWQSAEAAARILKDNYRILKSWPLAITAYNQGVNSMLRAVRQLGSKRIEDVIAKYQGRAFGFAGRNFYCSFVAALEVSHEYEKYFGYLPIDKPIQLNQHMVKHSIKLRSFAKEFGIQPKVIAEMNPHLRSSILTSAAPLPEGVMVNLPVSDSDSY